MPPELAVIIVSWNTRRLTLNALRTLHEDVAANGPDTEVWVVDCASTDRTPQAIRQQFPEVKLIASDTNLGFAAANNRALREIGFGPESTSIMPPLPQAVYLLNPDTETHRGATRLLFDSLFSLPHAGVVGAQLCYEDGAFQHGAFHFPGILQLIFDLFPLPARLYDTRLNGRYPRALYQRGTPFPVDHTLGATMMLRREVIQDTGLFDEGYFMYCEEIDWSLRIRAAGWEIYTIPHARVTHLAGQSTNQIRPQSLINLWRSRIRLFEQHYSPFKRSMARMVMRLGMRYQIMRTRRALEHQRITQNDHDALVTAYRTIMEFLNNDDA